LTTTQNLNSILSYKSGIDEIDDTTLYYKPFQGSRIINDNYDLEERINFSINEAVACSNILDMDTFFKETILVFSTTKGDIDALNSTDEQIDERAFLSNLAQNIAKHWKMGISPLVISNACISGVNSIITASRLIERGICPHAVVVGADLLSHFVVTGFQAFHSISPTRCIPYDSSRDGLSLGEAVGAVILTSQRDFSKDTDPVVVEGGAVSNDANHLSAPSRTGDGLGEAMLQSMNIAGVSHETIGFVNAHGTATLYNDEMESKAVHWANLQGAVVQSLKPYWGHTLGASGVVESIACFWQLKNKMLLGTLGFKELGVPMSINVSGGHKAFKSTRCIKTASGFGGCNASVVYALESVSEEPSTIQERGWKLIDSYSLKGDKDFGSIIRECNKELNNKSMKFFKMDDLSKLGSTGASFLIRNNPWLDDVPSNCKGLFMANFSSSLNTDIKHQRIIEIDGDSMASPAVFVYTLPNIVLGEICIEHKFQGENTFFILPEEKKDNAIDMLLGFAGHSNLNVVIIGWCELIGEKFDLHLELFKRLDYE